MKLLISPLIFILLFSSAMIYSTEVEGMSGSELLKKAQRRYNFKDSYELEIENIIHSDKGKNIARLKVYLKECGKKQLAVFQKPEKMKGDKYLVVDNNTWMHQEGLIRAIRISASQKLFGDAGIAETVGIDYYSEYELEGLKKEAELYILSLQAKSKDEAYQKVEAHISSDGYFKKTILKDISGTELKEISYRNYRKIGEHEVADLIIKSLLQNKGQKTEIRYIDIKKRDFSAGMFQADKLNNLELFLRN